VSEHAYSAVAEYVSFDWIRKEIPVSEAVGNYQPPRAIGEVRRCRN
jgi:hypothetical protein